MYRNSVWKATVTNCTYLIYLPCLQAVSTIIGFPLTFWSLLVAQLQTGRHIIAGKPFRLPKSLNILEKKQVGITVEPRAAQNI